MEEAEDDADDGRYLQDDERGVLERLEDQAQEGGRRLGLDHVAAEELAPGCEVLRRAADAWRVRGGAGGD